MQTPLSETHWILVHSISWTTVYDPDGVECCSMSMQIVQRTPSSYGNFTNVTQLQHIPDEYAQRRSYTKESLELKDNEEYVVVLVATNAAGQSNWQLTYVQVCGCCGL